MKSLKLNILQVFMLLFCATVFIGCTQENEYLTENLEGENAVEGAVNETDTVNESSFAGPTCNADCVFGDCEANCSGGQTPYCECDWGFAECGCRSGSGNDIGIAELPHFSVRHKSLLNTYSTFLSDNNLGDLADLVGSIKESIDEKNVDSYYVNLDKYVAEINTLNTNKQNLISDWLASTDME